MTSKLHLQKPTLGEYSMSAELLNPETLPAFVKLMNMAVKDRSIIKPNHQSQYSIA